MNLYLISQTFNEDYDTYDSAVVAAESEEAARLTPPARRGHNDGKSVELFWAAPEHVSVKLIGEAAPGTEAGVICASFNAG
jgi:hypothetical protein